MGYKEVIKLIKFHYLCFKLENVTEDIKYGLMYGRSVIAEYLR